MNKKEEKLLQQKRARIGETRKNNQGLNMTIISYMDSKHIDIQFEDGYIAHNKYYTDFKRGKIRNPNYKDTNLIDRTEEVRINNQGLKMKILRYRNSKDIDIEFEDGYISYNKQYNSFKKGMIENPNYKNSQIIDRTGEKRLNNQGLNVTIIKSEGSNNITVQFDDGVIKNCTYKNFLNGSVRNYNNKDVYGVACIGEGKHRSTENNISTKKYKTWLNMITRCFNEKVKEKYPTYKNVICCEEWLNFQNFGEWFDENFYQVNDDTMELDKDILIKGNKIYSPNTCIFVPHRINSLFVKRDNSRGKYPIGVCLHDKKELYEAHCGTLDGYVHLGAFNTPEEAFNSYKTFKEKYIKQVADEYKDKIPKKLYEAMYRYEVEITD